jgi:hypothetical protein
LGKGPGAIPFSNPSSRASPHLLPDFLPIWPFAASTSPKGLAQRQTPRDH